MTKTSKLREGKGILLIIVVVVVVLLVLVFMARQRAGEETVPETGLIPDSVTPPSSLNTNVQVPPPAESELDEKIDELQDLIEDFGTDLDAGKSLDFSDLEPDERTSAKFEDLE